jgi:hypothetical protein
MRSTLKIIGSCSERNIIIEIKMLKPRSRFYDKNAIKLTYGHIQIKKNSGGETPGPPFQRSTRGQGRNRV